MEKINNFINEKLSISKDIEDRYKYHPNDKKELVELLEERFTEFVKSQNRHYDTIDISLNDIDTSRITDMSYLFSEINKKFHYVGKIDISEWDVSRVVNMRGMFAKCEYFNCNLEYWDMKNVQHMEYMFDQCMYFNSDVSDWNVSNVLNTSFMFRGCRNFEGKGLDKWNLKKVKNMGWMFDDCQKLDQDLSKWDISKVKMIAGAFRSCKNMTHDKRPSKIKK